MRIILLAFLLLLPLKALAETLPPITVWKSPYCGCCGKWIDHMKAAGFRVETRNVENMQSIKKQAGIPEQLESCHTALVDGYVIEGHVPAADIKRLLAERKKTKGLAVPGMPSGSPGMENSQTDPYDVVTFDNEGKTTVFKQYR